MSRKRYELTELPSIGGRKRFAVVDVMLGKVVRGPHEVREVMQQRLEELMKLAIRKDRK